MAVRGAKEEDEAPASPKLLGSSKGTSGCSPMRRMTSASVPCRLRPLSTSSWRSLSPSESGDARHEPNSAFTMSGLAATSLPTPEHRDGSTPLPKPPGRHGKVCPTRTMSARCSCSHGRGRAHSGMARRVGVEARFRGESDIRPLSDSPVLYEQVEIEISKDSHRRAERLSYVECHSIPQDLAVATTVRHRRPQVLLCRMYPGAPISSHLGTQHRNAASRGSPCAWGDGCAHSTELVPLDPPSISFANTHTNCEGVTRRWSMRAHSRSLTRGHATHARRTAPAAGCPPVHRLPRSGRRLVTRIGLGTRLGTGRRRLGLTGPRCRARFGLQLRRLRRVIRRVIGRVTGRHRERLRAGL